MAIVSLAEYPPMLVIDPPFNDHPHCPVGDKFIETVVAPFV